MRQAVKTAAAHSVSLPLDIKSGLLTAFFLSYAQMLSFLLRPHDTLVDIYR